MSQAPTQQNIPLSAPTDPDNLQAMEQDAQTANELSQLRDQLTTMQEAIDTLDQKIDTLTKIASELGAKIDSISQGGLSAAAG